MAIKTQVFINIDSYTAQICTQMPTVSATISFISLLKVSTQWKQASDILVLLGK